MKNIGIIDLGSNSARLLIVRLLNNKGFKIIYDVKEAVRLGKDIKEDGSLNTERVEIAIKTMRKFKSTCKVYNAEEIYAVATAAVRGSKNQEQFLKKVKKEADIDLRVLSGEEEAFYDYFGIINSLNFTNGLIMDIGGASTEIAYVKDRYIKEAISLPFGAITLTEKFGLNDETKEYNLTNLKKYLTDQYKSIPWLSKINDVNLVGVGGTIRNIGKIHKKQKNYPLEIIHNYYMYKDDVIEIVDMVGSTNLKQRRKIKGLSKNRADIFPAACEAVRALIEYCEVSHLIISETGVKEGIIYETIQGERAAVENVLDFSINNLMEQYDVNKVFANKVWQMARAIYYTSTEPSNIDKNIERILKTASMLCKIGTEISCNGFEKHSFYMIMNSNLNGLNHKEILMAAYIILYHQQDEFIDLNYEFRHILTDNNIKTIEKLAPILKKAMDMVVNLVEF